MKKFLLLLSLISTVAVASVFPTSWNVTQTTNGMIVSAGQILATNDGSIAASAGNIGEIYGPISRVKSSALSLSTNTVANISSTPSITFDPGHYTLYAQACFTTAALTTVSEFDVAISATSATMPATDTLGVSNSSGEVWKKQGGFGSSIFGATDYCLDLTPVELSVATATTKTLYLVAKATFGISTMTVYGSFYGVRRR